MSFSLLGYRNAVQKNLESDERITKEAYQTFIAVVTSLCCLVHGFIVTQSELLIANEEFRAGGQVKTSENIFNDHFLALFFVGEAIGAFLSFLFSDEFGRKTTIMYSCILSMLSIVWYAIAGSASDTLTARFFVGLFLGVLLAICPVYISEIATASCRGQCVGYLSLSMIIGSLLSVLLFYLLEDMDVGWRWSLLLPMLFLAIQAVVLFFLPESPRWMLAQKTPAKCLSMMRQLRRTKDVSKEFNEIYRALTSDAKLGHDWWDLVATKSILLRLILCVVLEVAHLFVGMQFISIFGHQLFEDFGNESVILGLLLVLLAQLLGTGVFLVNIDSAGRRVLLLTGCACMGLAWLCAAISVYIATSPHFLHLAAQQASQLLYGGGDADSSGGDGNHERDIVMYAAYITQFLFGSALCVYAFSFALSIGSISWVYCAEIFPYRARSKAASIGLVCFFGASLLNTSAYTITIADIGIWGYSHQHTMSTPIQPPGLSANAVHRLHSMVHSMSVMSPFTHIGGGSSSQYDRKTTLSALKSSSVAAAGVFSRNPNAVPMDSAPQSIGYGAHSMHRRRGNNMIGTTSSSRGSSGSSSGDNEGPQQVVMLQQDYAPTYFLLQLASLSLLTGLFVYLCVPETKELRLESMEELFRVDAVSTVCGCCPDLRTSPLLGLRVVSENQKVGHRSATKGAHHMSHSESGIFRHGGGGGAGHYGSNEGDVEGGAGCRYEEEEEEEELVPSALHKYSAEMRVSKFNYIDEDEPLVPHFNLNFMYK